MLPSHEPRGFSIVTNALQDIANDTTMNTLSWTWFF
jgi:hypothetical protein